MYGTVKTFGYTIEERKDTENCGLQVSGLLPFVSAVQIKDGKKVTKQQRVQTRLCYLDSYCKIHWLSGIYC